MKSNEMFYYSMTMDYDHGLYAFPIEGQPQWAYNTFIFYFHIHVQPYICL